MTKQTQTVSKCCKSSYRISNPNAGRGHWEKEFDERFPNAKSAYIDKNSNYVWIYDKAHDVREMKIFIKELLAKALDKANQEAREDERKKIINSMIKIIFEIAKAKNKPAEDVTPKEVVEALQYSLLNETEGK